MVVYLADGTVHTYNVGQTIHGDEILPRFTLSLADVLPYNPTVTLLSLVSAGHLGQGPFTNEG